VATLKALFLDIGGVLLTNGWDTDTRQAAALKFNLDLKDLDSRHRMTFDTYEIGKIPIDEYLRRTVFYKKPPFTPAQFTKWIFEQSKPYKLVIELVRRLKKKYNLRAAVVSNEGRELTEFRIQKFKLAEFIDFFVCSSFVYLRKPDEDIYRLALDLIQVKPAHVAYLEDRALFVEVANRLGIHGIKHDEYHATVKALGRLGLRD
jgi:putative hydrolase of the HAD superfamily